MITELALENFRTFEKESFSFSPITVLVGNNGVGKTSVLEAISMLSLTSSWRTEKDSEVVFWEAPFCRVTSGDMELVIQVSPYMKRIRVNEVSRRAAQVIGYMPTILFQPDDLQLLYGAPTVRRQYIDRVISQTSQVYTKAVIQLQQVLKQRNRLLKNIQEGVSQESELPFWDLQLADLREVIFNERTKFLTYLQERVSGTYQEMVPDGPEITVHYIESPHSREHGFLEHLSRNRGKEIGAGVSLYGPHREDIEVRWGVHLAQQSMSRGQSRALMVAFKIAELGFITDMTGNKPILLLDDIFSELDLERRHRLFSVFRDYQTIMTTTELGIVKDIVGDDVQIIEL
jgi:DNA replication and repair protein RecF